MSEESEIGNPGESVNLSVASRAARIVPDLERLEKYDEYPAKTRKQKLKHLFWALLFGAPTALLIAKGSPWWSIAPGLVVVWNLFCFVVYRNASPDAVYENGLLCAAIIVNEDPLQIAVLAEMQTDEDAPTCWGVKRFDVKELPLHTLKKHERVPCAVMFGGAMPFAGLWSEIEPHPLCWASGDAALLEEAINAIDEAEWCTLEGLSVCAEKRQDIDFSKEIAYFNADFSPRTDLQEKPEASNEDGATAAGNPLMAGILWSFSGGKYDSREKFVEELSAYNREIAQREIDPDEIVEESYEIIVFYSKESDDDEPTGAEIHLKSDGEEGFSAGELLYKIHNRVVESLGETDHHFFEGLTDCGEHEKYPDIPFYYLGLGS